MLALQDPRTTVTLAADAAAAVEGLRRSEGIGVSVAVKRRARDGLAKPVAGPSERVRALS